MPAWSMLVSSEDFNAETEKQWKDEMLRLTHVWYHQIKLR